MQNLIAGTTVPTNLTRGSTGLTGWLTNLTRGSTGLTGCLTNLTTR